MNIAPMAPEVGDPRPFAFFMPLFHIIFNTGTASILALPPAAAACNFIVFVHKHIDRLMHLFD